MSAVISFYNSVINEVIESLKVQFNEEGIDPAVLNDLKEIWEKKIKDSGALEPLKHNLVQPAGHFSNIMQQQHQSIVDGQRNNVATRIANLSNPTSRLIKPSGQGSVIQDQNTFNATRMTVPLLVPGGNNTFRQVPMVINAPSQQQGMGIFSQYHNIINPQNHPQQIITENGVVNLRKTQVDGADDGSSEEEENDFVNVSEVDPQSVRPPMSNVPATPTIFKKETKEEETDEEFIEEEIENMNHTNLSIKNEDSEEDENDDDDDAEEAQNEEEPLNSEDDISDDDPEKIFETDNVIVCQYEKVNRTRNKWKLNFVSGIANLHGKDTVFHKAVGEAEW